MQTALSYRFNFNGIESDTNGFEPQFLNSGLNFLDKNASSDLFKTKDPAHEPGSFALNRPKF
jgi:hypothetical protein